MPRQRRKRQEHVAQLPQKKNVKKKSLAKNLPNPSTVEDRSQHTSVSRNSPHEPLNCQSRWFLAGKKIFFFLLPNDPTYMTWTNIQEFPSFYIEATGREFSPLSLCLQFIATTTQGREKPGANFISKAVATETSQKAISCEPTKHTFSGKREERKESKPEKDEVNWSCRLIVKTDTGEPRKSFKGNFPAEIAFH